MHLQSCNWGSMARTNFDKILPNWQFSPYNLPLHQCNGLVQWICNSSVLAMELYLPQNIEFSSIGSWVMRHLICNHCFKCWTKSWKWHLQNFGDIFIFGVEGLSNDSLHWYMFWYITPFFSCDQAALWMVQSVCLSVRLSVCLSVCLSHLFDYVPIIVSSWNFRELLPVTEVTSMQKVKVRGQRSRSQRSQPNFTVSGL